MSRIPGQPILDYASPLARGPLRLAERSILTFFADADGKRVVESLEGKRAAISAIVFSAGSMTILGVTVSNCYRLLSFDWFEGMSVYAVFALATAGFILAVIHSNWQVTILKTGAEHLFLTFKNPFKSAFHRWAWEQIQLVRVVLVRDERTQRTVYELHIETWPGQLMRLFRGHDAAKLGSIAQNIHRYLSPAEAEQSRYED